MRAAYPWVVLPAAALFLLGALSHLAVPGVYMDAVNPDYMVTRLLTPGDAATPFWVLPGVLLAGRFPVLGQLYHGALPFYAGLPAYALFGTGVDGIRAANAWFGLLVLGAAGYFLLACRVRPLLAGLALAALALDPGFIFAFRTQFYITLLPIALVLVSAGLVEGTRPGPWVGRRWVAGLAGLLAGLSVWGYFIYLFLMPAAAAHAGLRWRWRREVCVCWLLGLVVGGGPYLLGYALILHATGGGPQFLAFVDANLASLAVHGQAAPSLADRAALFWRMALQTLSDTGPSLMMLHEALPARLPGWKLVLTAVLPALVLLASLLRGRRAPVRPAPGLAVLAGYAAGLLVLVLVFGDRLWLHHMIPLLPILYCAAAVSLEWGLAALRWRWAPAVAVLVLAPTLLANAVERQVVFGRLEATGGVGLYSDAIDRFAEGARGSRAAMFFPDWGVFMAFVMITDGQVGYATDFTPALARAALCSGQDAVLATFADKPADRLAAWKAAVPAPAETTLFRQRDGVPVLEVTRWRAAGAQCG